MARDATSDELVAVIADVQALSGPPGPTGPRGPMGPQGPAGRDGAGTGASDKASRTSVPCKACGPLSGSRAVVPIAGDMVDAADALDASHAARIIGVTMHAVSLPGVDVEVMTQGVLEDSGFSLIPLMPVYVGPRGRLTQTADASAWAFVRQVGIALSETRVMIDLQAPILTG